MKNLKVKSILFSLMTVLMIAVFMTSCEQEAAVIETVNDEVSMENISVSFILPYGFDELAEEEQIEYLQSLTDEDREGLAESYRVMTYLESIGKIEKAETLMSKGQLFTDINLSQILSEEEISHLSGFDTTQIQERGACWCWYTVYTANDYPHGCLQPGWCCTWKLLARTCFGWNGRYTEYRHINMCNGSALPGC